MLWAQAVTSFLVWTAFGVWLARSKRLSAPAGRGTVLGPLSMAGGAAVLFAGLVTIRAANGLDSHGLAPWAWGVATLLGLVFVLAQAWGALAMVAGALRTETTRPTQASLAKEDME